jgi:hypothetical protein
MRGMLLSKRVTKLQPQQRCECQWQKEMQNYAQTPAPDHNQEGEWSTLNVGC